MTLFFLFLGFLMILALCGAAKEHRAGGYPTVGTWSRGGHVPADSRAIYLESAHTNHTVGNTGGPTVSLSTSAGPQVLAHGQISLRVIGVFPPRITWLKPTLTKTHA